MKDVFIISAKRTGIGGFLGSLRGFSATQLGAIAIREACAPVPPVDIEAVYMGNVLSAGLGQSPARQAALHAGLPPSADCSTINKVCASGLKAAVIGAQQIQLGLHDLVAVGGMESMSNTPHYLNRRAPVKLADDTLLDGVLKDGLTDAFRHFHMGYAAEVCAREHGISREEQDAYALRSYERAAKAYAGGKLRGEIIPVSLNEKDQGEVFDLDEDVFKLIPEKVPRLPPVFDKQGSITAANASNLNDGAAALVLASHAALEQYGLKPMARIIAGADAACAPEKYATAPALAVPKVLQASGLSIKDIDFFEINEAYAAVAIANQNLLGIDSRKLNIYGGAVAMGHPLGASGARILCTLLSVMRHEGGRYGLATLCNGGGGATALLIENLMN